MVLDWEVAMGNGGVIVSDPREASVA